MVDTEMTDAEREQARAQQGQGTLPAAASASGSGVNSDVMAAINKLGELGFAVKSLAEKVSAPTVPVGGSQDTGLANVKNFWSRPPLFTGENPEKEDVRTWLRLVGRMVAPLTNSSQGKADFVAGCLRGNAQSLYETRLEHLKPSFEELSAFLIKEFAEKNPEHHARLRLKHLRMKEGNLSAFKAEFTRNLSLCEKKPVHDADAIEYFYAGLTPELQNLLLMDPLTKEWWADLNTLMDAATLLYSQRGIKGKAVLASPVAAMYNADCDGAKFQDDKPARGAAAVWGNTAGHANTGRAAATFKKGKHTRRGQKRSSAGPAASVASDGPPPPKKKTLACWVCSGPHVAKQCPNKHPDSKGAK